MITSRWFLIVALRMITTAVLFNICADCLGCISVKQGGVSIFVMFFTERTSLKLVTMMIV